MKKESEFPNAKTLREQCMRFATLCGTGVKVFGVKWTLYQPHNVDFPRQFTAKIGDITIVLTCGYSGHEGRWSYHALNLGVNLQLFDEKVAIEQAAYTAVINCRDRAKKLHDQFSELNIESTIQYNKLYPES